MVTVTTPTTKPAPVLDVVNPEDQYNPAEHELQEARDAIQTLAEENDSLKDLLAATANKGNRASYG